MAKFNNQNNEDLTKLQLEAAKRVREMQSKIKKTVQHEQFSPVEKKFDNSIENTFNEPQKKIVNIQNLKSSNLFEEILKDNDKLLILTLIIILMGDENNLWVLLALLYLII